MSKKLLLIFLIIISVAVIANSKALAQANIELAKEIITSITKKDTSFVPGTEDIPVYEGFVIDETDSVSYDTKDGRIVKASFYATGVYENEIRAFYKRTLPQLGWQMTDLDKYTRDGEDLTIEIKDNASNVKLSFSLTPAS